MKAEVLLQDPDSNPLVIIGDFINSLITEKPYKFKSIARHIHENLIVVEAILDAISNSIFDKDNSRFYTKELAGKYLLSFFDSNIATVEVNGYNKSKYTIKNFDDKNLNKLQLLSNELTNVTDLIAGWNNDNIDSINKYFFENTKPLASTEHEGVGKLTNPEISNELTTSDFISPTSAEASNFWEINIYIPGEDIDIRSVGFLFQALSQSLVSDIETRLVIEHISNGSLIVKLKLIFASIFSEKHAEDVVAEVKNLTTKGYKAAQSHYLDNPVEEVEHLKAEKNKILKETELLQDKQQLEELRALEISAKQIELAIKQEELISKKLDNIKKSAELLSMGINAFGDIEVGFNNNVRIKKEAGRFIE